MDIPRMRRKISRSIFFSEFKEEPSILYSCLMAFYFFRYSRKENTITSPKLHVESCQLPLLLCDVMPCMNSVGRKYSVICYCIKNLGKDFFLRQLLFPTNQYN